jgi:predicted amidohydrolase
MDRVFYEKSDNSRYKVSVRFAGAQIPVTRDIPTNIESIKEAIDYAANVKADYVVTPEAALSGYYREFCESPEDQHNLITAESEVISYAKEKKIGLCLGTLWMENEEAGQIKRNQMRYFNKFGSLLGTYNKIQTIKTDNVIPGVVSEPLIGNEELFIPGNNGHPTVELSTAKGSFDVSTLICNDMYGENQYGTAIARRSLFSLKNRKDPVELVIHPTFGFRGDELCDPLFPHS